MNPSTSAETPYSGPSVGIRPTEDELPPPPSPPAPPLPPSAAKPKPSWAVALEWAVLIVCALVIALLIKSFLFQAFYIPSDSMVPTLKTDDRVIVNKLSYKLHPVHRGDVIVFKSPPNVDPSVKDLVKRVIALPGETVEGRSNGRIYINGKVLQEKYLPEGTLPGPSFLPIRVPADSSWVMGDNRSNSRDSRFFPEHFIRKKDIIGRVFLRIWPLDRLGIL